MTGTATSARAYGYSTRDILQALSNHSSVISSFGVHEEEALLVIP